jgi:hypothetical protein
VSISSFWTAPTTSGLPSTPDLGEIRERVRLCHERHCRFGLIWKRPPTEAALLPEAVPVQSVPDLKNDDHHDGRHQDRSGQYRQYRKHFAPPRATMPVNVQSVGLFQGRFKIQIKSLWLETGQYPRLHSRALKLEYIVFVCARSWIWRRAQPRSRPCRGSQVRKPKGASRIACRKLPATPVSVAFCRTFS